MFYSDYGSALLLGSLLTGIVPLGLLVLAIIAVATGRGEQDPTGRRGTAIYLSGVLFITLFLSLFAVYLAVDALTEAIGDDSAFDYYEDDYFYEELSEDELDELEQGDDDATTRAIGDGLEALLVAVPAVAVFVWHDRRLKRLRREPDFAGSPAERIDRAYLHATSFTAVLIVVVSVAVILPDILSLAAPGVTDPGESTGDVRDDAWRSLLPFLVLGAGAAMIFRRAWGKTPDGGRSRAIDDPPTSPTAPAGGTPWAPAPPVPAPAPAAPLAPRPAAPAPGTAAPQPGPAPQPPQPGPAPAPQAPPATDPSGTGPAATPPPSPVQPAQPGGLPGVPPRPVPGEAPRRRDF